MPRLVALAVRTHFGDMDATWTALVTGTGAQHELPADLVRDLCELTKRASAGSPVDAIVVATTKGDCPVWLEHLLAETGYAGGPGDLARRLGAYFDVPAVAVSAACASGTAALGVAARWMARENFRRVAVIGADRPHPFISAGFSALRAVDPVGCRPFAADRAGLELGEARAVVILAADDANVELPSAPALLGWGCGLDAVHLTAPDRTGSGLARTVAAALRQANSARPGVIIAHGTGTRFNDDAESKAYATIAPQVAVTASKGALGHCLGTAGVVDTAIAITAWQRGVIPGVAATTDVACAAPIRVLGKGEHPLPDHGPLVIANAGFGGINAAVVVGDPPKADEKQPRFGVPATMLRRVELARDSAGQLEKLTARDVVGHIDASWGRMDMPARALVALVLRLGELPAGCGLVLWSETGCAATDRIFERDRQRGATDPQRFPYTLSTASIGEASIRGHLTGPGFAVAGLDEIAARALAADLLGDGVPAIIFAHVEADTLPHTAWAEVLIPMGATSLR